MCVFTILLCFDSGICCNSYSCEEAFRGLPRVSPRCASKITPPALCGGAAERPRWLGRWFPHSGSHVLSSQVSHLLHLKYPFSSQQPLPDGLTHELLVSRGDHFNAGKGPPTSPLRKRRPRELSCPRLPISWAAPRFLM